MTETLSLIERSASEIAEFPAPLRRKIQAAFGPADEITGKWMLIGAENAETAHAISHEITQIELEIQNAKMRAEYLAANELLTAQQVRDQSGLEPSNKSEPASRWKREGKVFAVRNGGIDLYPAFQFVDGAPRPLIEKILIEFGGKFLAWQIAFWFESGNVHLNEEEPHDCLDQIEDVVRAARRLAEPTIG